MRTNFFKHELLTPVTINREVVDGTRFYRVPSGNLYPSVTTVLSSIIKKGLVEWRESVGNEKADRIMRSAATRGTGTHQICEDYLLNSESYLKGAMPSSVSLFKQIQPYLDKYVGKVYGVEIPLYSDTLKKIDQIQNYFYQTTAYAIMAEEIYKITIPTIVVLISTEDEGLQCFIEPTLKYREIVTSFFQNYSCNISQ